MVVCLLSLIFLYSYSIDRRTAGHKSEIVFHDRRERHRAETFQTFRERRASLVTVYYSLRYFFPLIPTHQILYGAAPGVYLHRPIQQHR